MRFPEDSLRTGLPVEEVQRLAQKAAIRPDWIADLIEISGRPQGGTASRKASWILRHVARLDTTCIAHQSQALLRAIDQSGDPRVHRELLKALLDLPKEELEGMGEDLYELGLGLCADPSLPVAMVHVGVQLLHTSGQPLGEEVVEIWRERGAQAETPALARFLAMQLASRNRRST